MKKSIKNLLVILSLLNVGNLAKGQVSLFGRATSGMGTTTISSGLTYMDAVRTKVSTVGTHTGSTVTLTVASTTGFSTTGGPGGAGDMALLIQMKNGGGSGAIGIHQNVIVTNINTGSSTIDVQTVSLSNVLNFDATNGGDKLQLIRIPEYYSLTVSGGIITCNPWDNTAGTGGVLCFMVKNVFYVSGGLITVAAKGFTSEEAPGISYGTGTGGAKAGSWSGGGITSAPTSAHLYVGGSCTNPSFSVTGQNGGTAGSTGTNSQNTGTPVNYGSSTFQTDLRLGTPGYWQTGYGGGIGAQGGGVGGAGANSTPCTTSGSLGSLGQNGGPGGNAGKGGRGGGAMVIKAGSVNIGTLDVVFSCDGQNGNYGGVGSNGGSGGIGGNGAVGCCILSTPVVGGGHGANGDEGAGGDGGDGGNGGKPGFIWIAAKTTYFFAGTNRSDNFSAAGGKAGKGGAPGYGGHNTTGSSVYVTNICTMADCPPNTGCTDECDVDRAMCKLATDADNTTNVNGSGNIEFKNSGNIIGEYNMTTNDLKVIKPCSTGHYFSNWRAGNPAKDPDDMFPHFVTIANGGTAPILGAINYAANPPLAISGCGGSITYPVHIEFYNTAGDVNLIYHHQSKYDQAYIEENGTQNRCYSSGCFAHNGGTTGSGAGGTFSSFGPDGADVQDGSIDGGGNSENVVLKTGQLWKRDPADIDDSEDNNPLKAILYPNPSSKEVWVELNTVKACDYSLIIFDMNGKQVLEQNDKLHTGRNKVNINIKGLAGGIYVLQLKTDLGISHLNLQIE